jgi:hypothetical protein
MALYALVFSFLPIRPYVVTLPLGMLSMSFQTFSSKFNLRTQSGVHPSPGSSIKTMTVLERLRLQAFHDSSEAFLEQRSKGAERKVKSPANRREVFVSPLQT